MVAERGGGARAIQALLVLFALLAGCTSVTRDGSTRVAKQYHSMPRAAVPLPRVSTATTLPEYQREVARLLHAANRGMVFEGPPPNPVRAVVVMRAEIDVLGEARRFDLIRAPWHDPWLEMLVEQTWRRAEPFPRPSMKLLKGSNAVTLTETWLFDYQGRFRLRTLSQAQAGPAGDGETR